jgi:DeoR/GlpR family transcriptional regulator of sugar metabolism
MLPFNADICNFAQLALHKWVTCHMTDSVIFGYRDRQVSDQDGDTMSGSQRLSKRDRQQRILAELRVSATLRISELATELGVSYETIRRDLEEMGESGLINRTYGGAVARPFGFEPAWSERANAMTAEREHIASLAIRFVRPGEVLMIDAGSTTLHFARRLAAELKDLTVITNSFAVAQALATNPAMTVIACPGRYDVQEGGVAGPDCIAFLGRYNANRAVIGASGLTLEGPNEANSNSAAVKRAMFARAQERMLLIDHLKFGQPNLEVVCPLQDLSRIVTDKAPSRDMALALRKAEIELNL